MNAYETANGSVSKGRTLLAITLDGYQASLPARGVLANIGAGNKTERFLLRKQTVFQLPREWVCRGE